MVADTREQGAALARSGKRRRRLASLSRRSPDWFTEGFNTRDLKEAKALLDELAA